VRTTVSEIVYEPGVPRKPHIRPTDQIIVFLDECEYERTRFGDRREEPTRKRKAGEIIWHDRSELAPQLVNKGSKAYRTLLIELKDGGQVDCHASNRPPVIGTGMMGAAGIALTLALGGVRGNES
jgi:hypothetical protein